MGNFNTKVTKDHPSSRYIWEIQSFSLLKSAENVKYESACFQVGGHDWRLVLYPSGNKRSGGKDHISLYLKLCESEYIRNGGSVEVKFKLFLFDPKNKKHLIGNADGGMKHFDKNRNTQGFDQLISLKDFQKKSSRYLHNDRCTFGVDVFVKPTVRREILSVVKNPKAISLKFEKFSTLHDHQYSNKFTFDGKEWQILLHPKGHGEEKNKSLSIYLMLCDDNNYEKFYVEFKLRVRGKSSTLEKIGSSWSSQKRVGFVDFVSLKSLNQKRNGYIENDTLTVEVEILQVSVVKNRY